MLRAPAQRRMVNRMGRPSRLLGKVGQQGGSATRGKRVMPIEFSVSDVIPASPQEIYDAWLDSEGHAQITGGQPARISASEGAEFMAWNGYISGRNLKLEPGRRIVQAWR